MIARTYSATLVGVDAMEVEIESHDGGGTPKMFIFGPISPHCRKYCERRNAGI